jgi:ABC-type antimicrobial peptide transport system permease subunit
MTTTHTIIIYSVLVAGIINFIENLIHYNIGYNSNNGNDKSKLSIHFPNANDMMKIIFVTIAFATLQYYGTLFISRFF